MKKYNIIYADPPWSYKENWGNGAVKHHYKTMPVSEIAELPVDKLAAENCHLYLWVTNPFIREGLWLIDKWGFEYKQIVTWVKTYKNGNPIMGLGYYFRVCTEHLLFAVKGSLPRIDKGIKNIIIAPKLAHSEKPDITRDIIVRHSGDLPRIELFARQSAPGWDVWGNEVICSIDLEGVGMNKSCLTCAAYPNCTEQKQCKWWAGEYDDRRVVELKLWKPKEVCNHDNTQQ